jgi:dienelactone hydrolase
MGTWARALLSGVVIAVGACTTRPSAPNTASIESSAARAAPSSNPKTRPTLRKVGTRGFFALDGPFAEFDPGHPSVEVWTPPNNAAAPIVVYAHGGAGFREDDRARVQMFRRHGFATISFDSYLMNGFTDWEFVNRSVSNSGKQSMIWGVFRGAIEHAMKADGWDHRNLFLYGGSNGARVILYAGSEINSANIRGIIAEAPAGSGFTLGDYDIPSIILFGALDTWAGTSDTDFVWKRTYPDSPISIEAWVNAQQARSKPVKFIFYLNAGHLLFEGPLERVTVRRGEGIAFSAYRGAAPGVLEQYERDVMAFVNAHRVP